MKPVSTRGSSWWPGPWTGPRASDLHSDGVTLLRPVPPARWPYGLPDAHEDCCILHDQGLFCDCKASAADDDHDLDWGVYIDRAENHYGRMIMGHMIGDSPSELHAMAAAIGMQRRWFQAPPAASFWHYDVSKSRRALAIAAGAIDCDRNTFVAHLQRIRASKAFGDLAAIRGRTSP